MLDYAVIMHTPKVRQLECFVRPAYHQRGQQAGWCVSSKVAAEARVLRLGFIVCAGRWV